MRKSLVRRLGEILIRPLAARKLHYRGNTYDNAVQASSFREGCNLIGFARGQFGIGQHLRLVAGAFSEGRFPTSVYDYARTDHPLTDDSILNMVDQSCPHRCNLFCMNNDGILDLWESQRSIFRDRYNIAYGYWELSEYPRRWLPANNVLDEIWAPTSHIQDVLSAAASIPVVHMPPPVDFELPEARQRNLFDLPEDAFIFMFSFDFGSTLARKNPGAVIEAFKAAFPASRSDVLLVLKTKTNDASPQQVNDRKMLTEHIDDPRILLIDRAMDRAEMIEFLNCGDVYVSLHRAEGFGLGLAESMRMGKAVIATAYSGNLDFTTDKTAELIDYRLIPVQKGECFGLEGRSVWADPEIDQAAAAMQRLADDSEHRQALAAAGQLLMESRYNNQVTLAKYMSRLQLIGLAS